MPTDASRSAWLGRMLAIRPAPVPVGHTIRSAIGVGAPFVVGALTGEVLTGMWIAMASLLLAPGEREASHRLNLRILLISTPFAIAAYGLGYAQGLSLWVLVPLMAAVAFVCGAMPAWGAPFSTAGMQVLLVGSIALGVEHVGWWQAMLWYLVGAALYLAMMLVEFALDRRRPERLAVRGALEALRSLAAARLDVIAAETAVQPSDAVAERRALALAAIDRARAVLVTGRGRAAGSSVHWRALGDLLDAAESAVALLVGADGRAARTARDRLAVMLGTPSSEAGTPVVLPADEPTGGRLRERLSEIEHALTTLALHGLHGTAAAADRPSPTTVSPARTSAAPRLSRPTWRDRLTLGPDALGAAGRLALVFAAAIAARAYLPWDHWFWVPLTVALVMKPDFGSVFARAVLRVVGTVAGAAVATAVLALAAVPALAAHSSLVIAVAITALAACVPWFMQRSYALQALAIAPIVILLVAVIEPTSPGHAATNYSGERIGATIIGGALVLVLGYLPWRAARSTDVTGRLTRALAALGEYVGALAGPTTATDPARHATLVRARRATYAALADLRTQLQRTLGDAPPASAQAQRWIPAVLAIERLADDVTVAAAARLETPDRPDDGVVSWFGEELARIRPQDGPEAVRRRAVALHDLLASGTSTGNG